ncbi:MAG TPA: cyanophycin synthetase [Pirellulales bacterium]|nr:cyanophycin synthetase [Pirellulales bacterium]
MEIQKILVLRGPNIWANFPVLEAWVDLGDLKDSPSNELPGFNDRLMAWLPTMIEHRCSVGERGGFFERLRRGTYQAHILEHVTLELQSLAGATAGYGRARETSVEGVYKVVVEYEEESFAEAALRTARELCLAAVYDRPFDMKAEIARLRDLNQSLRLGPSTRAIADAAKARGIPVRRLNDGNLVQLGYGKRQHRIWAAETDRTGAIAEEIAQDKDLTRMMLRMAGVPVPEGRPVANAEDAWTAAQEIGTPVVIKPQFGNQGKNVATFLTTKEQVVAAFNTASEGGYSVVCEKFVVGADYRLLIIGEKLVAAAKREPAQVMGDGIHTVAELIDHVNTDPRRGNDHATPLSKIRLDPVAMSVLAEQGLLPSSVPPAGTPVLIRRNGNLSTGGTAADVTELVHPEITARAIDAARTVGLDVAGVDVLASDIGRPLEDQGGAIVEVNAGPGLRMHIEPSSGQPRPVGAAILSTMFAPNETGRIPIVSVTGTNGKTTTTRFIAHLLRSQGLTVGMTCTDGIYIDQRRIDRGDCAGPKSARAVLFNSQVEAAVFECARGGILREGLGFDLCDVAVVTNIAGGDHLGVGGVDTLEQLVRVKRCIVEAVAPHGYAVLKADDPLAAGMAEKCPGKVIYFSTNAHDPLIASHRETGGRAVFVRGGQIVAAEGAEETVITSVDRVPLTHRGRIGFQVENALATAAAGWALGQSFEQVAAALATFAASLEQSPGRFNLLEIRDTTVIVDYGHNVSALEAIAGVVEQFPHGQRSIVYTAAGDRRDSDLIEQGALLGRTFDRVILYEDHYRRGRAEGEIIGLFRRGMTGGTRAREVFEIQGAVAAVEKALAMAQPGELLVIQADEVDETVDFVRQYLQQRVPGREIDLNEALVAAGPALLPEPEPVILPHRVEAQLVTG